MAFSYLDLEIRKSTNLAGDDCLGDAVSSTIARSQLPAFDGGPNITGVTLLNAFGAGLNTGRLHYNPGTSRLSFYESGSPHNEGPVVSSNGTYLLLSASSYFDLLPDSSKLIVSVVSASLPGTEQTDDLLIPEALTEVFDDISGSESWDGDVEYRCLYLANLNATAPLRVLLWVETQPEDVTIGIALDTTGSGAGTSGSAIAIANESTSPGLTFSAPSDRYNAIATGPIGVGEFYPFWIRRTVTAETLRPQTIDLSVLGIDYGI